MKQHIHGGDVYRHQNVIDFSANCNPLGPPNSVKEAIAKSVDMIQQYPDVQCAQLRQALEVYEGVPMEQIRCGNGAAEVIFTLVLAKKPKKALLPAPTFAEYEQALRSVDCEITYYRMEEKNEFRINEEILSQITGELDILFLCNPNNPTGLLCDTALLERILEACVKHTVLLVLDECFVDFLEQPEKYTMKAKIPGCNQLFILKAFTKRYAMAGIRLGYGISSNLSLLERMQQATQPWNVSIPAQAAGIAALQETQYVEEARTIIRQERGYLKNALEILGLHVYDSKANYIFFKGPENLKEKCLKENALIRDCSNYPGLASGYYRTAIRTHPENEILLRAIKNSL